MNPAIRNPVVVRDLSHPIEVVNQRAPVATEMEKAPKSDHPHKQESKVEPNDPQKTCLNMDFMGSTIMQDNNPLWVKIPGVVLGESDQFSYKQVPCKEIWTLLPTIIDDLKVTVINYNQEKGVAFLKTGFDVNIKNDVAKDKSYTAFVLKSKLVGNPFLTKQ